MSDDARGRLLRLIPYLRYGVQKTAEMGKVELGFLATKPDGSGTVMMRLAADKFVEDLAAALDAPPQTEEDDAMAAAAMFLDHHGIRGGSGEVH